MTSIKLGKFRPVRSARNGLMREQVVHQVRVMIQEGKLKPGDRIPPERELARQLGISRPSLRAGLRFLGAIGVVTSRHGSGTYVAEGPPSLASEPLHMLAALHGFTAEKMFEARRVVEVAVAGLAAEKATDEQLMRISEEVSETYAALDEPQEYLIHDFGFHRAIAAASGNPILATIMEMVSEVLYQRRRQTLSRAHDLKESVDMHRKIYRAIRARDANAARVLMSKHLLQAERDFASEELSDGLLNEIGNKPVAADESGQLDSRPLADGAKLKRKTA